MDITRFNKELGSKIAKAKWFEKNNETKSAIKIWLEISEMTISLSKSRNLNISFKNMLINRTKQIFEHIKELKSGQFKEVVSQYETPAEYIFEENENIQEQEIIENSNPQVKTNNEITEDSEYKKLPTGFKEIKTSEDFEIITPHDEDFVKKQLDKAFDSEYFKTRKQETEGLPKSQERSGFEQPRDSKNKICFACGYDKNLTSDKTCKNCGINLD